jgi:predicted HTH domain antitoxin
VTVTLEIPRDIEQQLVSAPQQLPRWILEAVALEGYRQERLSQGQVGKLLGLNFWETETFLKERRAYLHYDVDDLESDIRVLRELREKR